MVLGYGSLVLGRKVRSVLRAAHILHAGEETSERRPSGRRLRVIDGSITVAPPPIDNHRVHFGHDDDADQVQFLDVATRSTPIED
eukprot:PDM74170.1 hypothetical protein PRIPAC_41526 [Pristionchus pacificus]